MKLVLCLAAVSVLALSGCTAEDPSELDDESSDDVGEAAQALCPTIFMPLVDTSIDITVPNPYGGGVSASATPADSFYDPDNFTVEATFHSIGVQMARMSDPGAGLRTSTDCANATATASFWVHDASTGCWSFSSTTNAVYTWTGSDCEVDWPGISVPHSIDKVRMSGNTKKGAAFRTITGTGLYLN